MNFRWLIPGIALVVCAEFAIFGCATSQSTAKQIERQMKYLEAAQKVYEGAQMAVTDAGERIEKGQADLKALLEVRDAEVVQELIDAEAPAAE